jgi:hypothetical protein
MLWVTEACSSTDAAIAADATRSEVIVRRLNPDLLAAFGDAAEFTGLILAAPQSLLEFLVFGGLAEFRVHEHAMVLAPDFIEPITQRAQKILVGGDDRAVEIKLDHRLRLVQRLQLALSS